MKNKDNQREFRRPNFAYSRGTVAKAAIDALIDYSEEKNSKINREQITDFSKYLAKRKKHLKSEY